MKETFCKELLHFLPSVADVECLYSSLMANCIINAVLAISTVVLNCVTIHAVRRAPSLSTPLKTLLLSLAISDLGIGLLSQPFYVVLLSRSIQHQNLGCLTYTAFTFVIIFFTSASLFGVMAISIDRYTALHLHLRYQELVTQTRVVTGVASLWILCAIFSSIFLSIDPNMFALIFAIAAAGCLVVTSFLYCSIYEVVRRHNLQIQRTQVHQESQHAAQNDELLSCAKKYALGTFYVYVVFLLCYLPHALSLLAIVIGIGPHIVMKGLYNYSLTITFLNSALNPIIYCWKMRHIRHAIVETFRSISPSRKQQNRR